MPILGSMLFLKSMLAVAFATAAYRGFDDPYVVERIEAAAGIRYRPYPNWYAP